MVKIKGHTVGNDGVVYDPDSGDWGYVSQLDSRVANNSSDERGALVTDRGRVIPINRPAAGAVQTGPGGGGSGPGAKAVGAGGGSGPGSAAVVSGPLKPKLKPTVTKLMVGGDWWHSNPWFSDADEYTQRYGEGELAETLFLLTNVGADLAYNAWKFGKDVAGPGVFRTEQLATDWLDDAKARVTAPIPPQEPVDWGR